MGFISLFCLVWNKFFFSFSSQRGDHGNSRILCCIPLLHSISCLCCIFICTHTRPAIPSSIHPYLCCTPCTVNWHLYHATSPIEVFSAVFTFPSSHFFAFTTLFALWLCLNLFDTAIKASAVYRNTALQYFLFVHYAARQIGWLQSTARNGNAV